MWRDKMKDAGKLIECTLVGNIYDKNRDRDIKEELEKHKKGGAD
jgi:hypothetical protein